MDKIKIQPDAINSMRSTLVSNSSNLSEVNRTVSALLNNIDSKIQNRRNIHSRLAAARSTATQLNEQLKSIEQVINQSVSTYNGVENYLVGRASALGTLDSKRLSALMSKFEGNPSKKDIERYFKALEDLYDLYDVYGNMSAMMLILFSQTKYYGLGLTKFVQLADGLYDFKHADLLVKFGKYTDDMKYGRNAARLLLHPKYFMFSKYRNADFADLIHKNFAKFLPKDVVNFTNTTRSFLLGLTDEAASNVSLKSFLGTGAKFAKTNVLTTLLVTGVGETIGMGIDISKNYQLYSGNPEKLKEENAKAVGRAVNKTTMITAGSVAGTFVGGALGSFFGPVGTVVGGVVGSTIGGFAGEALAGVTEGFAENLATYAKNPIQSAIDGGKNVFESAGKAVETVGKGVDNVKAGIDKGIDQVKNTASSLVSNAKKALSFNLSFG